jgi:arylsulfatase A-like enzyme
MYEDVELLSEKLQNEGYNTGGFIGAHALNSRYGFSRGFDVYDEDFVDSRKNWALGERRGCEEVTDRALSWLSTNGADEFLFVHYFDAHDGGHLPTFTRERIRETRELVDQVDPRPSYGKRYYLRQMNRIDEQIGRLITHLKKSGSYADSLIIIMGDHGDAFGEHGEYNHREYLYDTTLHVPLIVKLPSNALKGSCSQLVRLSDITPTVCSLLDLPVVEMDGKPLLAEQLIEGRPVYAETRIEKSVSEKDNIKNSYVGLRTHRWKLILNQLTDEVELYDVVNDSGERKNMASQNEAIVKRLKNAIDERLSDTPSDKDNRMEQGSQHEMVGRLRSLGYLE